MADLTTAYNQLRDSIYRVGDGKEELRALPNLPTKAQLLGCFQAYEDFFVANATVIKTAGDTALGRVTSQALFRKLLAAYLLWKLRNV